VLDFIDKYSKDSVISAMRCGQRVAANGKYINKVELLDAFDLTHAASRLHPLEVHMKIVFIT